MKMSKRDWVLTFSMVFVIWGLDQVTKWWAVNNLGMLRFHGPLGLVLHRNPGAMLGIFSDLPPILRIVSLSTGGAFLIFIYAAIQYLLPSRSLNLRVGMSILLGGILGNVTDRILFGSVVDFLVLGSFKTATPAFNLADALQWVGYFMIVASLVIQGNQLWPEENVRRKIWVNPLFQMKYIGILLAVGMGFSIICAVFSFTYLKVVIDELVIGQPQIVERKFITPFLITFAAISGAYLLILFLIGRILSHRTAGPIYAFERFLEDITSGRDRALRIRAGDEFTHLEELGEKIRQQIKSNFSPSSLPEEHSNDLPTPQPTDSNAPVSKDETETADTTDSDASSDKPIPLYKTKV
jgi:signal peptidase II